MLHYLLITITKFINHGNQGFSSGCSRCKKALEVVNKVVGESGIDAQVEYVTDIMRVMEYNVMGTPAVVVDGVVKIKGSVPTEADVRKALGL